MCLQRELREEGGVRVVEAERGGRCLHSPMPPFALRSLRGKKRELERSLHCSQSESRQRPASLISLSTAAQVSVNFSLKEQPGGFLEGFLVWSCLGPWTVPDAGRSTRCPGANLAADRSTWVQFKVRAAVCVWWGGARWSWTCVCSSGKSEINSGHSFCFIVSLRAWFWCALAPITQ